MGEFKDHKQKVSRKSLLARRGFFAATGVGVLNIGFGGSVVGQTSIGVIDAITQPSDPGDGAFIERAFEMRRHAIDKGDQAYGAVIVRDNEIVGQSWSRVILDQDPTAHAEMAAIRDAAHRLQTRELSGTVMYSSSRPCPMCEAAAFWAGVDQMIFGRDMRRAGPPTLC